MGKLALCLVGAGLVELYQGRRWGGDGKTGGLYRKPRSEEREGEDPEEVTTFKENKSQAKIEEKINLLDREKVGRTKQSRNQKRWTLTRAKR